MTRGEPNPKGKVLIVGGGIANFTNVAATFKGIVRALKEFKHRLSKHAVRIFVRRGGPNYQEGLKLMRELGETISLPIHVFGPETHITAIVPMALGIEPIKAQANIGGSAIDQMMMGLSTSDLPAAAGNGNADIPRSVSPAQPEIVRRTITEDHFARFDQPPLSAHEPNRPFTTQTRAFIYGMQPRAVQGMLDFDNMCKRTAPSVAAMIYPFGGSHGRIAAIFSLVDSRADMWLSHHYPLQCKNSTGATRRPSFPCARRSPKPRKNSRMLIRS